MPGYHSDQIVEHLCEVMHDAYEEAALQAGWATQERSRKPWAEVPAENQATMRAAVQALLVELGSRYETELSFRTELETLLNRHSLENGSSTPDFILADYLCAQLDVFNLTVNARSTWYGRSDAPGQ